MTDLVRSMPEQLGLALDGAPAWLDANDSIDARFWRFHNEHPEVYRELSRLAREAKQAGRQKIGIGMLFEVIRWHRVVDPDATEEFKLNNNYRSRYSRLLMEAEPELDGIFDIRELRAA